MSLHPELAALQRRYDELVDAVEDGTLNADVAMSTLGSLCATDSTGAEWRLDAAGNWTRNLPGETAYPADPVGFVTTAGWSDNGWNAGAAPVDPYRPAVSGWGNEQSFAQPFAPAPAGDPYGYNDSSSVGTPTAPPAGEAPRRRAPKPRPRLPKLPSFGGLGDRFGSGRARTVLVVAVCLFIVVGLLNRPGGSGDQGQVPETLTTVETEAGTTTTPTGSSPDTTVPGSESPATSTTGDSTAGAAPAVDTPRVTTAVEPGKGVTLEKAQAVIDALVGGAKTAEVVTGATGGQLIEVAAPFAGAAKLGFKLRAESFTAASKTQADLVVEARDRSGRTVASWTIRLVTAKGRWVVGGYPTRN